MLIQSNSSEWGEVEWNRRLAGLTQRVDITVVFYKTHVPTVLGNYLASLQGLYNPQNSPIVAPICDMIGLQ